MTNQNTGFPNDNKLSLTPEVWREVIGSFDTMSLNIFKQVDIQPIAITLSEPFSLVQQALHVDLDRFKGLLDTTSLATHLQGTLTSIQPDFRTLTAELAEISKISMATQAQAIANAFKPDYTDIFASLSDFSTISNAMQVQALKEITKPNANELFASLAKISMPTMVDAIQFDSKSIAGVTASFGMPWDIKKSYTSFGQFTHRHDAIEPEAAIWFTAYDLDTLRRREKVVAILKETGIHYETPLFGAYDSYMRKHIDYERHTLSSMRTIFEKLIYRCVRGIHKIQIISILQKAGIPGKKYTDDENRFIRSRAAVYYLTLRDNMQDKTIRKRIINLSMELNKVHDENIQITDKKLYMVILEMEVMICEVFPDWLNQ